MGCRRITISSLPRRLHQGCRHWRGRQEQPLPLGRRPHGYLDRKTCDSFRNLIYLTSGAAQLSTNHQAVRKHSAAHSTAGEFKDGDIESSRIGRRDRGCVRLEQPFAKGRTARSGSAVYSAVEKLAAGPERVAPQVEAKTPAVSIRWSITPDFLICLDDGKRFKSLRRHLATLGLTPAQYREKWNLPSDYPMVAPNYAAQRSELAKSSDLARFGGKPALAKSNGRPKAGKAYSPLRGIANATVTLARGSANMALFGRTHDHNFRRPRADLCIRRIRLYARERLRGG
jgi:predicted transcriptional regulator